MEFPLGLFERLLETLVIRIGEFLATLIKVKKIIPGSGSNCAIIRECGGGSMASRISAPSSDIVADV
jgi:hypothetical protein